jgi:hypothetical protein
MHKLPNRLNIFKILLEAKKNRCIFGRPIKKNKKIITFIGNE